MRYGWLAMCVVCAVVAAGCGATRAGGERVVVVEDDPSLPRGCRPAEVAGLLAELFDAADRGDRVAVKALLVDPETVDLMDRSPGAGPRRLRAVIVGYANGLGQIEFRAAGRLHGKGAVQCDTRRFAAIGLGAEHASGFAPLCGRRPTTAVLACVRHWE